MSRIMGPGKNDPSLQDTTHWMLVFGVLLAFRIVNALTIKTFFQPDEYFQALEPAWKIAFGADSGAWITWVRCRTRSSAAVKC
jgi:phosphatidylinositol glycan class B